MLLKEKTFLSDDINNKRTQTWAALSMGLFVVFVGIPIWWKTTEVYRAALPFDEIRTLNDDDAIKVKIPISLVCREKVKGCSEINKALSSQLNDNSNSEKLRASNKVLFHYEVEEIPEDKENLNLGLTVAIANIENNMVMVQNSRKIICNSAVKNVRLLGNVIRQNLVNEDLLQQLVANIYRNDQRERHNMQLKKMVQTSPKFQLLFSLLCPEPEVQLATWDMGPVTDLYLNPIVEKLKDIYEFHIGSQILYYTKIPYRPQVEKDAQNNIKYRFLSSQQLSLAVNPIEGRLGSQISTDPTLNFVVYMAEKKFRPLFIKKDNGELSKTNTFLVPRWGSIQIYNLDNTTEEVAKIDPDKFMNPFVLHLRVLLGLSNDHFQSAEADIEFQHPDYHGITDWELDYLTRLRTAENVATATHTLHSLSRLLNKISNIVINDNIATEVYASVEAVTKAKQHLAAGELSAALLESKKAFASSEKAFFDPTLLELLYFPEDQKFAIYVPLFLPISLPILVALFHAVKRLRKGDFEETEPKEKEE